MKQGNTARTPSGSQFRVCLAAAIAILYIDTGLLSNCPAIAQQHRPVARKPIARPPAGNSRAMEGYLSRLRVRLINNWTVPDGKNVVVLEAVVDPSGTATDVN